MDELTELTKKSLRTLEQPHTCSFTDGFITKPIFQVGGANCDCCGKIRQELGLTFLNLCTRCKMAYYCSKECQKAQWKAGHKQACRKEGQIEIGDLMQLQGLVIQPQLNGLLTKIQGPADTSSGSRWAVYLLPDEDRVLAVSADRLKHLRLMAR
jgi:hypothetical protein